MAPNLDQIRQDFPTLSERVNDCPLIYLDTAASALKPQSVIDAVSQYYVHDHSNVHRSIHTLSERATVAYENARTATADFIHASHAHEIVFTRGATESINLVAQTYVTSQCQPGDEIIVTVAEHHSNFVPWQQLADLHQLKLVICPLTDTGMIDTAALAALFTPKTKMLAIHHVSNVLGTINPVKAITQMAHDAGVPVLIDGAQAVPHMSVDVTDIDCDFYAFSGHKLYGPTGIGVLYAKTAWLEKLPPYQSGGSMVKHVTIEDTAFETLPYKFEAGTPHIAGAVGLHAAITYLNTIGMEAVEAHSLSIAKYAEDHLKSIPGIRILGHGNKNIAALSFVIDGVHSLDLATLLDQYGIAVRAGHHCAMPLMQSLGLSSTTRVSFGLYTGCSDIDCLIEAIERSCDMIRRNSS